MKKIPAILLIFCLLFSCGCGEQPGKTKTMRVRISADPGEDPFIVTDEAAPDPFVTYDQETGYYYGLCTQNDRISIFRHKKLADLFITGETKNVYQVGAEARHSLWAPEMVRVNGKWYIYTSAALPDADDTKHLLVLESETGDPFDGFHFGSYLNNDLFAIDPTYYHDDKTGKSYLCFSEVVDGLQWLSISEMADPLTLTGSVARISDPNDFPWERAGGGPLNEGPFFISSGSRTFIIYSANGCYNDAYRLGCLELTGDDPLQKANWKKSPLWVFAADGDIYAPGHASFFHSPDGTELWIAYHCYDSHNVDNQRRMRVCQVQKVGFDESGYPSFGKPLQKDTVIPVPSGE